MKIYTKTGDKGTTSLVGGTRVAKSALRIEAYGTVDELNSYVGLVRDQAVNDSRKDILKEIQTKKRLPDLLESDVTLLESAMDLMDKSLEPMRFFILPGGHQSVSFTHIARTVCRRAERLVIKLSSETVVDDLIITYLNRLSDYLFVLCRMMAKELEIEEVAWKPRV
jgi:cob(I)alamin adenosyltransferase